MAWFTFTDVSNETFVIRLTDPADVAHARGLLAGTETGSPHIAGTVVKTAVPYNIGWSYHIEDISFFEISTEVGDSTMRYIEKHLVEVGGALLPGSVWTGWSSELVAELAPLHGSANSDALNGSGSADIIFGNAGDDAVLALAGNDYLVGGGGNDTLFGKGGDDRVAGGFGADRLHGGIGADVLAGGHGADRLSAGIDDSRDRVIYGSEAELLATDQIFQFDFRNGASELVWDRIDLRSIDADQRNGDQAFRFVEVFSAAGTGEADGQLRVVNDGRDVIVEIDFNGDSAADAYIVVRNVASLGEADFFL
jgi:hypothetical protein